MVDGNIVMDGTAAPNWLNGRSKYEPNRPASNPTTNVMCLWMRNLHIYVHVRTYWVQSYTHRQFLKFRLSQPYDSYTVYCLTPQLIKLLFDLFHCLLIVLSIDHSMQINHTLMQIWLVIKFSLVSSKCNTLSNLQRKSLSAYSHCTLFCAQLQLSAHVIKLGCYIYLLVR